MQQPYIDNVILTVRVVEMENKGRLWKLVELV
jgi:hypothetical protein